MPNEVKVLSCDGYYAEVSVSGFDDVTFIVFIEKDSYYGGRKYRAYCSDPSTKAKDDILYPIAEALKKRIVYDHYGSVPCNEPFILAAAKAVMGKESTQFAKVYGAQAIRNFASLSKMRQSALYPTIKHIFAFYFQYLRSDLSFVSAEHQFSTCPVEEIAAYALAYARENITLSSAAKSLIERYIVNNPDLPIGKPLLHFLSLNPFVNDPEASKILLNEFDGIGVSPEIACLYCLEHHNEIGFLKLISQESTFDSLANAPLTVIRALYFGLCNLEKAETGKTLIKEIAKRTEQGNVARFCVQVLGEDEVVSIINELAHSDDRHYHSYYDGETGPFFAHTFFNHQDKYSYISTEYAIELLLFGIEESRISRYGDLKLDIRNYIKKRKSYDYGPSSDFPEHAARALYLLGDSWIYKYLCDETHYTEEVRKSHPFLELLLLSSRLAKRSNEQEYPL